MTQSKFLRFANNRWKIQIYLFWKLPAAWFLGIKVHSCSTETCIVRLPYSWRAQNPFRSTYFAAQCAAGELSTGMLLLTHLQGKPPISMLVTHIEADFFKKASETLTFTCSDGQAFETLVQKALESGAPQTFVATSTGVLPDGIAASRVRITWSIRKK